MKKKEITKRGVLYVGFYCNMKCKFCYYRHTKNKRWKDISKLKKQASRARYFYRNGFVDITGGEPTIYPNIFELIEHCKKIGLKPTLITNGLLLADKTKCLEFKKSGINDFLVSIYGLDKTADYITEVKNVIEIQEKALKNLNKFNIPFRINVTVHKFTAPQLPKIAEFAAKEGAQVLNMIIFNPFYEWQDIINIDFQEKYSNIAPYITKAIKILEKEGIEANVRFLPLCQLRGFEKNIYNFKQLSYDPNEWDFNSWGDFLKIKPTKTWYEKEALRRTIHGCGYQKSKRCGGCSLSYICDGFHNQYVKRFGFGEEKPYLLKKRIKDPTYFIQNQGKLQYSYKTPDKTILKYLEDEELFLYFLHLLGLKKSFKLLPKLNFNFIDKEVGKIGLFLKKHFTNLYFELKRIKQINNKQWQKKITEERRL